MQGSFVKKSLVGIIAVAVIGVCAWRIITFLDIKIRLPRRFSHRPARTSLGPRQDPVRVLNWRVYCAPVLVTEDSLDWGDPLAISHAPCILTAAHPRKPNARVKELLPAVQIHVESVVEWPTRDVTRMWPGLKEVQIQRGPSAEGPFETVVTLTRKELDTVGARSGAWKDGKEKCHRLAVLDREVSAGSELFYRAVLDSEDPEKGAKSGPCSTWVLPVPKATLSALNDDSVEVAWSIPDMPKEAFESPPGVYVCLSYPGLPMRWRGGWNHTLVLDRFDEPEGSAAFPIGTASTLFHQLNIAISGALRRSEWSLVDGVFKQTSPMGVVTPVLRSSRRPVVLSGRKAEDPGISISPEAGAVSYSVCQGWGRPRVTAVTGRGWDCGPLVPEVPWGPEPQSRMASTASYRQSVGFGRDITFTVPFTQKGKTKSLSATLFSPPRLDMVRAIPKEDGIHVSWTPLNPDPENWAEKPAVVIQRARYYDKSAEIEAELTRDGFREVARLAPEVGTYVDSTVNIGQMYLYTVHLEGLARAQLHGGKTGSTEASLPVHVGGADSGGLQVLIAEAGADRPLKVSVVGTMDPQRVSPMEQTMTTQLEAALGRQPWITLTERRLTDSLLDEERVADTLGTHDDTSQRPSPKTGRAVSDILLSFRTPRLHAVEHLDVWVKDFRNQLRFRLMTAPVAQVDPAQYVQKVVAALAQDYGRTLVNADTELAPQPDSFTVAILDFVLAADSDMPTVQGRDIAEMVGACVSEHAHIRVVERERLDAILHELETAALSSEEKALQLGQVAGADVILTGSFAAQEAALKLHVRALHIASGQQIATVDVAGASDDLIDLGRTIAERLAAVSLPSSDEAWHAALADLDLSASEAGSSQIQRLRRQLFVKGPTPKLLVRLAVACFNDNPEETLALSRQVLATKNASPSEKASARGLARAALGKLGRLDEKTALLEEELRRSDLADEARRRLIIDLAKTQWDADRPKDAARTLRNSGIEDGNYEVLFMREQLGVDPRPLHSFLQKRWFGATQRQTAPWFRGHTLKREYAAGIRLMRKASAADRLVALKKIAMELREDRPWQTRQALLALEKYGPLSRDLLSAGVGAAAAIDDAILLERWLPQLTETVPETSAAVYDDKRTATVVAREGYPSEAIHIAETALRSDAVSDPIRKMLKRFIDEQKNRPTEADSPKDRAEISNAVASFLTDGFGRSLQADLCLVDEYGRLLRLNPKTLDVLWSFDLKLRTITEKDLSSDVQRINLLRRLEHILWVTDSTVFVSNCFDGILYAVDARSGRERWRHIGWGAISAPVFVPERNWVCVANGFGELLIFAPDSGRIRHHVPAPREFEAEYAEQQPDLNIAYVHDKPWEFLRFTSGLRPSVRDPQSLRRPSWSQKRRGTHRFSVKTLEATPCESYEELSSDQQTNQIILDKTQSEERRWQSINHLGWNDVSGDVSALKAIITDEKESMRLRESALITLGRCNAPVAMDVIKPILAEPNHPLRESVPHALGRFRRSYWDPPPPDNLAIDLGTLTKSADADVNKAAKEALAIMFGARAKPWLEKTLNNPDDPARRYVAYSLGKAGDHDALPVLREYLDPDKPFAQQPDEARILSRLGDPTARAIVIESLEIDAILRDIRSSDGETARIARQKASMALHMISEYAPDPALVPFIATVREAAGLELDASVTSALCSIGTVEAVDILIDILAERMRSIHTRNNLAGTPGALATLSGRGYGSSVSRWVAWRQTLNE